MSKTEELLATRISGLLDFYSDRAVAHASFLVASVFGIVTILAIIKNLDNSIRAWVSIPFFLAFSYMGYHSLARFSYYANISQKLMEYGLKMQETFDAVRYKKAMLRDYVKEQGEWQKKWLILERISGKWLVRILGLSYWVIIIGFSFIVYSQFWKSWIEGSKMGGILIILPVLFVIIFPKVFEKLKQFKLKRKVKRNQLSKNIVSF